MVTGIFHEGKRLREVIVVPPKKEYFDVNNLAAHNIRAIADAHRAKEQHAKLREIMRMQGAKVIELPELAGHPNSVFAMDTAVSLGDSYIKLRMGLATRRGEDEWMAGVLEGLSLKKIGEIKEPGTAEGGDLIPAYPVFFIGLSSRTNREGAEQIKSYAEALGYEPIVIKVPSPHLHLGGAMTVIDEQTVVACSSMPLEKLRGFEVLRISCKDFISGNVINLGNGKIIAEARNLEVIKLLKSSGYEVFPLDLSEFVKGSGGPSCLILPLKRG